MTDLAGLDPRHLRTARLQLDAMTVDDTESIAHLGGEEDAVWWNFPSLEVRDLDRLRAVVRLGADAWDRDGLGYWCVRMPGTRVVLGFGGCSQVRTRAWNLYYRMRLSAQGQGYAHEVVAEALRWAAHRDPDVPVTAVLRERNVRARAVVDGAGLTVVRRVEDPLPEVGARLVYADRPVPDPVTDALLAPLDDLAADAEGP